MQFGSVKYGRYYYFFNQKTGRAITNAWKTMKNGTKYHYDRVLQGSNYKTITLVIDIIISAILVITYILKTCRTFNIYDISKYELNVRIIKIKNKTKPNYDIEKISKEKTLKGLFVKEMMEEIKKEIYDDEILENALEIGIEILE